MSDLVLKMKRQYQPIEWSGVRHPSPECPWWILEARFRIGDGDRGFYNVVSVRVGDDEWKNFGPNYVSMLIERNLIPAVKEAAYQALCNDALMLDLSYWCDRARRAEEERVRALNKADMGQEKLDTIRDLLGIV